MPDDDLSENDLWNFQAILPAPLYPLRRERHKIVSTLVRPYAVHATRRVLRSFSSLPLPYSAISLYATLYIR